MNLSIIAPKLCLYSIAFFYFCLTIDWLEIAFFQVKPLYFKEKEATVNIGRVTFVFLAFFEYLGNRPL